MKRYLVLVFIVGCGSKNDSVIEPEKVRVLSLDMAPDTVLESIPPQCARRCDVIEVSQELLFCYEATWNQLSEYVAEGQNMYCYREVE